jgi:phosphoglucosamine mutase
MVNVRVKERVDPAVAPAVQAAVQRVETALAGEGRVVLRASGTEPVIRVMVEGREETLATRYANELAEAVRTAV